MYASHVTKTLPPLLIALTLVPLGLGPVHAEATPTVWYSDTFDDTSDWDVDAGWTITDNRARNSTALYFGDDKGTTDPEDNDINAVCEDGCDQIARSPTFTLPASGPMFLYAWTYTDVDYFFGEGFHVYIVHDGPHDGHDHAHRTMLEDPAGVKGWFMKRDLAAFAGKTVHLELEVDQSSSFFAGEGVYVDDLLVTDADVIVENIVETQGEGAATDVAFEVPEGGLRGTLEKETETTVDSSVAGIYGALLKDGDMQFGFGFHFGAIGANVYVDLLGEEVVEHDETSDINGMMWSGLTLYLSGLEPGTYRYVEGVAGGTNISTTIVLRTPDAVAGYAPAAGGEELAQVFAQGFESEVANVVVGNGALVMVDGHHSVEATGAAFGFITVRGTISQTTYTTPAETTTSHFPFRLADEPGTWAVDVHLLVDGDHFPYVELVRLPVRPHPMTIDAVDLSGLPLDEVAATPPPEPDPWPDGYLSDHNGAGYLGCGASFGPVQTRDACEDLDANSKTTFRFPLDDGLTRLVLAVATEGPDALGGDTVLCATVLSPPQAAGVYACSDRGDVVVFEAPEGSALEARDGDELVVDVRSGPDQGVIYQQTFDVGVEAEYWGGPST